MDDEAPRHWFHDVNKINAGISECRYKCYSGIVSFTVNLPSQSGIGIPASTSVRYRWSRISPVVPSYAPWVCWRFSKGALCISLPPLFITPLRKPAYVKFIFLFPLKLFGSRGGISEGTMSSKSRLGSTREGYRNFYKHVVATWGGEIITQWELETDWSKCISVLVYIGYAAAGRCCYWLRGGTTEFWLAGEL
jgi:hypothetical protein